MAIHMAVPVLRVSDVHRSMDWYRSILAFTGNPFPAEAPHQFAILRRSEVEIMLRRGAPTRPKPQPYDWDLYLRLDGTPMREFHAALAAKGLVTRRLERMFYGLAEFEITDPDGYVICLSQQLDDMSDLPTPAV